MSERKLATIQTITDISKIENADNISLAIVRGWGTVVKNGEFNVGDSIIFCEIDSWIPEQIAPFLSEGKTFNGVVGGRVRTKKLRGVLSQGLVLPLSKLLTNEEVSVGDDVTGNLGILKWENLSLTPSCKEAKGNFPCFIPKTDQERVQNLTGVFDEYKGKSYEVSIKLDGSSFTGYSLYNPDESSYEVGVCSRTLELKEGNNKWWECAKKYNVLEKLKSLNMSIAIQAEMLDTHIQGNWEKVNSLQMYVFDIFDIKKGEYLLPSERTLLCSELDLPHVPVMYDDLILDIGVEDVVEFASGKGMNEGVKREGLVFKCNTENRSFKAISNEYLLKNKSS